MTDSRGSIESENGSNAFQLNVYCWILEAAYGRTVGERMYFAVVHEDLPKPRLVKISHLQEELEALITDQLKKGLAVSRNLAHCAQRAPQCTADGVRARGAVRCC